MFVMNDLSQLFWNSTVGEIGQGYRYLAQEERYVCLICGKGFTAGLIYPQGDLLMDAERAVRAHIEAEHGSAFAFLVAMDKRYTGLTDAQRDLFKGMAEGLGDQEIARQLGVSASTVRNHRFKLREKEKQAKVFLALSQLLEKQTGQTRNKEALVPVHREATMVDDRYVITRDEREKILRTYLKDGKMVLLPAKEKKKLVILQHVMERFEAGRTYTEKDVNEIIRAIVDDFVTVRRYLIEYGFMDRKRDGSAYWVKT
jgi:hypothetical protein